MNLENSMKITTKIRIIGRKTDEGWSYEWCNYYTIAGYQIVTDAKTTETENEKYFNGINFAVENICYGYKIYVINFEKMEEKLFV